MKILSTANLLGLAVLYSFAVSSVQASLILGSTVLCPALRRAFEGDCDCSPKFSLFGINIAVSCTQPDGTKFAVAVQRRNITITTVVFEQGNEVEIVVRGKRQGLNPENATAESCEVKVNGRPCQCTVSGKLLELDIQPGNDCYN